MAEINLTQGMPHGGRRRSKKLSTKVDLTPMVDLGFLLITFFIFTTSMTTPTALKLYLPKDAPDNTPVASSKALTVIPVADHKLFYYHGELAAALLQQSYGITSYTPAHGLGDLIREKQRALDGLPNHKKSELMLIIKPAPGSHYADVVDALDEVLINDVKHYALVEIDKNEVATLRRLGIQQ